MKRLTFVSLAAAVACTPAPTSPARALSRTTTIASGDVCANGGTAVESGLDDDGDGALGDAEVDASAPVCNTAPGQVSRTSTLDRSIPECLGVGGIKVELGLDNGDGGGVARDGVLQDGEVDASQIACTGKSFVAEDVTPPSGAAGTNLLLTGGGNAQTGSGGSGGQIGLSQYGNSGKALAIFATGAVDGSFTPPTVTPVPGSNPLTVTTSAIVYARGDASDTAGLANPSFVTIGDRGLVYSFTGTTPIAATPYTSLSIAEGATLTVAGSGGEARLQVLGDIVNNGTIVSDTANPALTITCVRYVGGASSTLTSAATASSPVSLIVADVFINAGTIQTKGLDAVGAAGSAAPVSIEAGAFFNTGTVSAIGGASSGGAGQGGNGGVLNLSGVREFANGGTISSRGGTGAAAGSGAHINISSVSGDVKQSGAGSVSAQGGNASSACAASCANGAAIEITARRGSLVLAGSVSSAGGLGGNGGEIRLAANNYSADEDETGSIQLGAIVDTRGGSSTIAGNGGNLNINSYASGGGGSSIKLYGYAALRSSGGTGSTNGGNAGGIYLSTSEQYASWPVPGSSIVNHAAIESNGGNGGTGSGGDGAEIRISMSFSSSDFFGVQTLTNHGAMSAHGGASTSGQGGAGGGISLYAADAVANHGALDVSGASGASFGGRGGEIVLTSEAASASNDAAFLLNGGHSTATPDASGGDAGTVVFEAPRTANRGAITAHGGNGAGDGTSGAGGIVVFRQLDTTVAPENSGATDVQGGTGGTLRGPGAVVVGGVGPSQLGNGWD